MNDDMSEAVLALITSNWHHIRNVAIVVGILTLCTGASCQNNGGKVTPNPPVITDQSECAAACANLQQLHCSEGDPIDMGHACQASADCLSLDGQPDAKQACVAGRCQVNCTNFCIDTENQGVWLDPGCVKGIKACSEINSCPLPKKPGPTCEGPGCNRSGDK
jgi:hypothetical protein